jgi:SpoVK/Ycf46/Vps4 family AAA+-type ATPase
VARCTELSLRDFALEDRVADARVEQAAKAAAQIEAAQNEQQSTAANAAAAAERRLRKAEAAEAEAEAAARQELQTRAMAELNAMVGFEAAKEYVRKLVLKVQFVAAGGSKRVLDTCRNLVLTGNPGVGKTTFARLLHKVLYAYGVLKEDVFVERNALQLKGEYVGQTTPKVVEAFAAAKGGTLFLDEAYALCGSGRGGDTFARDAIATLLTEAETHRLDVMVVLAGYAQPMQCLLDADPGLRRRFPAHVNLPDYTSVELARIAADAARQRFEVQLGEGVEAALADLIRTRHGGEVAKHNASLPIRMVEDALAAMAERTMASLACADAKPDLTTLLLEDFTGAPAPLPGSKKRAR